MAKPKTNNELLLYQIRITLAGSRPPIWRRIVVRSDTKLDRLHDVFQVTMGWTDTHLHEFRLGETHWGVPDPDNDPHGIEVLDERRYTAASLSAGRGRSAYLYDFGDYWVHEVVLERVLQPDAAIEPPVCIAGRRACPPEDCGGIRGYYQLVGILDDPSHTEHEEMMAWVGYELDPAVFDIDQVNRELRCL